MTTLSTYWWIHVIEFCMFSVAPIDIVYTYSIYTIYSGCFGRHRWSIYLSIWSLIDPLTLLCPNNPDNAPLISFSGKHSQVEPITYTIKHTINNRFICQLPWADQCIILTPTHQPDDDPPRQVIISPDNPDFIYMWITLFTCDHTLYLINGFNSPKSIFGKSKSDFICTIKYGCFDLG